MHKQLERYLNWLAKKYLTKGRGRTTVIAVAGSVGKTSTKVMIGQLLESAGREVRYSLDSYNSNVGLPLSIFGYQTPRRLRNPIAWLFLVARCELQLLLKRPEIIVLELGIDAPGDMTKLLSVVQADYVVLTATTAEHLETVGDQATVIAEETSVIATAKVKAFVGADDVDTTDVSADFTTYGIKSDADWRCDDVDYQRDRTNFSLIPPGGEKMLLKTSLLSNAGLKSLTVTIALGRELGLTDEQITTFTADILPHNGRMRLLPGINGSQIIDDSYNSSPAAIVNALETLSRRPQKKKLFIMGMINEMGDHLPGLLEDIRESFKLADEIIIVGSELAVVVQHILVEDGVPNRVAKDALDASTMVRGEVDQDTVLLFKGSQGNVYLEEGVKQLLANTNDTQHLVRQTPHWLAVKSRFFGVDLK